MDVGAAEAVAFVTGRAVLTQMGTAPPPSGKDMAVPTFDLFVLLEKRASRLVKGKEIRTPDLKQQQPGQAFRVTYRAIGD